jgi:hypothetical protein
MHADGPKLGVILRPAGEIVFVNSPKSYRPWMFAKQT